MNRALAFLKVNKPEFQRWYFLIWAWLIPSIILFVLSFKFWVSPYTILQIPKAANGFYLLTAISLLSLNIWLEAAKWKILVKQWKQVTFADCFKIILAGKSLNAISPLGMGEAFAKYIQFEIEDFDRSIIAIALARISQMIPTLIFGFISVYFILQAGFENADVLFIFISSVLFFLVLTLIVLIWNKKAKEWCLKYINILKSIKTNIFYKVILLSFFRYAVFSVQFILIFFWVGIDVDWMVLTQGVFWIFFIKTIVPNVSVLGDLANRELSSYAFFSLYLVDLQMVSYANFFVWLINIILPALLGLFFIKQIRIVVK